MKQARRSVIRRRARAPEEAAGKADSIPLLMLWIDARWAGTARIDNWNPRRRRQLNQ